MDDRLDHLHGQIIQIEYDMDALINVIKDLSELSEYRGSKDMGYKLQAIRLMSEQIRSHVATAVISIDHITSIS